MNNRWVKSKWALTLLIGMAMNTLSAYAGANRGDIHTVYKGQSVDDLIIQYMEENNVPGLALAIVQAPYITRVVGYGLADTDKKLLVATRTMFNIGQITNAYTGVAIMQLKEEGKLKLDDPVSTYLTNLPTTWQAVTIRQLLNHSSGLPDYTTAPNFNYSNDYQVPDLLNLIKDKPLAFQPGTQMETSATNPYLLGLIIEKASGMSYQDYVTKNQIERVGLKHTFFVSNVGSVQNEVNNGTNPFKHSQFLQNPIYINPVELATGYGQKENELTPIPPLAWTASFANSGIIASAEDISLWDIALAGNILVKDPDDRAILYNGFQLAGSSTISPADVGWLFPGHKGLMEIKGNVPGYSSFLSRFTAPNELLCVTLLANKENLPDLNILARKIAGAFDIHLAVADGAPWAETVQSPYSVKETIARVMTLVQKQGGKIFAHINHSEEAKKANETLPPTEVVILGNPAKGTALMQANPAFALDLPLRIMATQDASGQVWLSFTDPVKLAQAYGLDEKQMVVAKQISLALRKLSDKVISAQTKF